MEPLLKHCPGGISVATNTSAARLILKPYDEATVIQTAHGALSEVGGKVSLGFVFASADYRDVLPDFLELLQLHAHIPVLIGCSGSGVIGIDREAEGATGFSLLLLHLPETKLHVCTLNDASADSPQEWHRITGVEPGEVETWIALCDPFGFPVEPWLSSWDAAYPGVPVIGGLCSGPGEANENVFIFRDRTVLEPGGALLVGFKGGVTVRPLLSQGCRPIGEPLTVTGSNGNMVLGLGGKPAYTALSEAFETLDDREKDRAQGNLFAGLASSEYIEEFKQGDFLIRAILGADANTGAVALGAYPRVGQTLQWQVRDRVTADSSLREMLLRERGHQPPPFASLVFACNGRGKDLFGAPNHDAHALRQIIGSHPSSGLFCNGEIGPIGPRNYVHGYTVAMALFG
jgi:small ligand-binding sensory domain FIST